MKRPASKQRGAVAPVIGVAVAVALIALAIVVPWARGQSVYVNSFPPLHADWMPRLGPGTIAALILAVLAVRFAVDAAARLRWRWLLLGAFAVALAWLHAPWPRSTGWTASDTSSTPRTSTFEPPAA